MKSLLKSKIFWLMAALAAAGWWWWHGGVSNNVVKTPSVIVRVTLVEIRDMPIILKNVGTVVTSDSVAVRSRLDSQIMEVKFKDGDYVERGDLLFVLDDRTIKADLAHEEAQLANLKQQYERTRQLAAKQYEARSSLDAAKAAYEAEAATVESLKVKLEYTRITAPISGRTGTISVTAGNTVKANDATLVVINQVKPIRVQVSLPQRYLNNVRESMASGHVTVTAMQEGSAVVAQGTLEYIDNTVDQSTGTFAARATFPNENEALWPGMFVNLSLMLGEEKSALVVPEVAIQRGQTGDFVFVIAGDKAEKRDVKLARLQNSVAIVETGLAAGEQVAVDGLMSLTNGSAVTIQSDKKQDAP